MIGQRPEDGHAAGPADDSGQNDAHHGAAAVNEYVLLRGHAAVHKGLVVFVQTGKAYTEGTCHHHKPRAAKAKDIKWESHGHCEKEVLSKMSCLTDVVLGLTGQLLDSLMSPAFIEGLVGVGVHLDTHLIAELGACVCVLIREHKDQAHHYNCWSK